MAISNKKVKQRAKRRRKEHKNKIKSEKEASRIRKLEKAERNRRFVGQESKMKLPEDSGSMFNAFLLLNQRLDNFEVVRILENLYYRQFFFRLMSNLRGKECSNTFSISINLFQKMGLKKNNIKEIIEVFEFYGAHCDCEVIYNLYEVCMEV